MISRNPGIYSAIIVALRALDGQANRQEIREEIAKNPQIDYTQQDVFGRVQSAKGHEYSPFQFDLNFGVRELAATGYVELIKENKTVRLTDRGKHVDPTTVPTNEDKEVIDSFWASNKAEKNTAEAEPFQADFTWIKTYSAIADSLVPFAANHVELVQIVKSSYKNLGMHLSKMDASDKSFDDIDPFTFFGLFNKHLTDKNRIRIVTELIRQLKVNAPVPTSFDGIPLLNNLNATYYPFKPDQTPQQIDDLWALFLAALNFADHEDAETQKEFINTFNAAIKGNKLVTVGKLTIGLFWIRPERYLNLDMNNRTQIINKGALTTAAANAVKEFITDQDGDHYLRACTATLAALKDDELEYHSLPELSVYSWEEARDATAPYVEYDPKFTDEEWDALVANPKVFTPEAMEIMKDWQEFDNEAATCTQVAMRFGKEKNYYLTQTVNLAKRIAKEKKGMTKPSGKADAKWWPIVFNGYKADAETPGSIVWQLRSGLKDALDRAADGGQRYWWLNANPKIWTFSMRAVGDTQSYTIRSDSGHLRRMPQNFRDAKPGDKFIGYETSPTKQIVALGTIVEPPKPDTLGFRSEELLVNPIDYADIKADPDLAGMEFLKIPNGSLYKLSKNEFDTILDIVREANPIEGKQTNTPTYSREKFLEEVFLEPSQYDSLVALLKEKLNVILQGAPGVGKTYSAKRLAWSVLGKKDDSHITMVQFHQNYAYEDFVIGYRPQEDGGFKLTEGKFVKACRQAQSNPNEKYFFIIDEINRGNLSKIFGELLMAIEKDYRGQPIPLAYGDKSLIVPKNLYIIGMMNTADRSLAIIDYALRRRFSFVDMKPAFETKSFSNYLRRMSNSTLDRVVEVVKQLNDAISKDEALGPGFEIGHSYFCNGEKAQPGWLKRVVDFDLKPTLDEYWFDNQSTAEEWKKKLSDAVAEDSNNA